MDEAIRAGKREENGTGRTANEEKRRCMEGKLRRKEGWKLRGNGEKWEGETTRAGRWGNW